MRTIRLTSLALVALLLLSLAPPAIATETPSPEPETSGQEADIEGIQPAYEAAVPIEETPPPDTEQPWTTKFLVPTGLLLAALAIFATAVMYFVRVVRTRYKVVE